MSLAAFVESYGLIDQHRAGACPEPVPSVFLAEPQRIQGAAHRVIRYGPVMASLAGKHIPPLSCQRVQASQQRHGLHRQWHGVGVALLFFLLGALHFHAGDDPQRHL